MKNDLVEKYIKLGKVVPATFDPVFKAVLKDPSTRDYLVNLINYITKIPKKYLKDNIRFSDNEPTIERAAEKGKRVDLLVDVQNKMINIELNMEYYIGINQKNNSYAHKLAGINYSVGEDYKENHYLIQISIDNYDILNENDSPLIRECAVVDLKNTKIVDKYYKIYHVNLDKTLTKYYNKNRKEDLTFFEKSLIILTRENKDELRELCKGDEILMSVEKKIEELSLNEEIVGLYDAAQIEKKVLNTKIRNAKEEGIQQGLEQGKIDTAKKMLEKNMDINIISEITGLTTEEITNLNSN